jgi:8-oxo-dGTP pyrophosphatase MutT (NUDIX family)
MAHLARANRSCQGTEHSYVRKKISAGLILVRTPKQTQAASDLAGGRAEYQAVVVKGRLSYAFSDFAHGRYDQKNTRGVRDLIAHMSIEERLVLQTLDFADIWAHVCARDTSARDWRPGGATAYECVVRDYSAAFEKSRAQYVHKRNKFTSTWLSSDWAAEKFRRMVGCSTGVGDTRWEFPKGKRVSAGESDVACALREFTEETNISPAALRLVPAFARVEMYVHMGVLYTNTYYLAVLKHQIPDPASSISLKNREQISEVVDVRWMGLDAMKQARGPVGRDLQTMGLPAFAAARKFVRGPPGGPRPLYAGKIAKKPKNSPDGAVPASAVCPGGKARTPQPGACFAPEQLHGKGGKGAEHAWTVVPARSQAKGGPTLKSERKEARDGPPRDGPPRDVPPRDIPPRTVPNRNTYTRAPKKYPAS